MTNALPLLNSPRRPAVGMLLVTILVFYAVNSAVGQCGNGIIDPGEDCDDGGTCIGGANAGTHCTSESQCAGNGVCAGGLNWEHACSSDADCPGDHCIHCLPQGGDGCAANCTGETSFTFPLQPGTVDPSSQSIAGSGIKIYSQILDLPLPLSGAQNIAMGKDRG